MKWEHEHHCRVRKREPQRRYPGMVWEWFCVNPHCNQYGASQYWKRALRAALEHVWLTRRVETLAPASHLL